MTTPEQIWKSMVDEARNCRVLKDEHGEIYHNESTTILAIDKERTSLRAEVAAKESSLCAAREALDDQAAACCGSEDNPCGWCKASRASLAGGKCRHLEELEEQRTSKKEG